MLKHSGPHPGLNGRKKFTSSLANGNPERQQEEFMEGVLAITFFFGSPVVIVLIVFGFSILRYSMRQRTIRIALEKGMDISPLLAEETTGHLQPYRYVLRGLLWGLTGLLIGVGVTWSAIRHEIPPYAAMFGWIPVAVGAAYLIFYRLGMAQSNGAADSPHPDTSLVAPRRTTE